MKYTINQIALIAESGKAETLPIIERRIIRQMLHNNIESHRYHGGNLRLPETLRADHFEKAKKLAGYLKKIPTQRLIKYERDRAQIQQAI